MTENTTAQFRSERQALESLTPVEVWLAKIGEATKRTDIEQWCKAAQEAQEVYEQADGGRGLFNIFHANTQILAVSLYNSTPVPDVRRRFGDKDPIARKVSELCERLITYTLDQHDFDSAIRAAVLQALVPGRGTARMVYEPEISRDEQGNETIAGKRTAARPVAWHKWGHGPGRTWDEVPFIYFEHDLTEDEVLALLQAGMQQQEMPEDDGIDPAEKLKARLEMLGFGVMSPDRDAGTKENEKGVLGTTCVYEVWDRASNNVYFIAEKDKEEFLAVVPDRVGYPGGFPMPRPIQFETRVDSLVPLVPYDVYRSLVEELDQINTRIFKLTSTIKARGLIDPRLALAFEMLREAGDGEYVAADNRDLAGMIANGGSGMSLEKFIAHMPLEAPIIALRELYVQRQQTIDLIYQATGISDIMRGAVDPREKLGQSQIKAQTGSLRMKNWQNEVSRFCRDMFRLMIDVIAAEYTDEEIQRISAMPEPLSEEEKQERMMQWQQQAQQAQAQGMPPPPQPDMQSDEERIWPQVMEIFRSDELRSYKIDIETDSTLRADMQAMQEQMQLFLGATSQFAEAGLAIGQQVPQAVPAMIAIYLSFTRKFNLGKTAEDALEALEQMAPKLTEMQRQQVEDNRTYERENRDATFQHQENIETMKVNGKVREEYYRALVARGMAADNDDFEREQAQGQQGFEREKMDRDEVKGERQAMRDQANKDADREERREERQMPPAAE